MTDDLSTSEREIGAYALLLLRNAGLITTSDHLNRAVSKLGVTRDDLEVAMRRFDPNHPRPLSDARLASIHRKTTLPEPPPPPPAPKQRGGPGPKRKVVRPTEKLDDKGVLLKQCSIGKEWKQATEENFYFDKTKQRLKTICREHMKEYQQERFLSAQKLTELNELGIVFTLTTEEGLTDLRCRCCDKPFEVGQRVLGRARFAHADCASRAGGEEAIALAKLEALDVRELNA